MTEHPEPAPLPPWLVWTHRLFIGNLLFQMFYASWQVFVVLQPAGQIGPAFGRAVDIPFEMMIVRRAYALEGWVAFGILAVYIGVTEIVPRRLRR